MTLPITRDRCLGLNAAFPYLDRRWPWRERGPRLLWEGYRLLSH
jgi:hypothetical protein